MSAELSIILNAQNNASGAIRQVTGDLGNLDKMSGTVSKGFQGLQNVVGVGLKAAGAVGAAGIAAVGTGLGYSINKAQEFENAMANVAAISKASDADLAALTRTARELGATTSFTGKEAAEGMSFLAMAGFEVNDIIAAMPGVLNLAAAGAEDLATVADIASNIISGFGLEASEASRVADVMAYTMTTANTDIRQLGEAMKYAAPVAASMGVSIEDTAAAIGKLSDAGLQGTMAGTSVRQMLIDLASPTGAAKDLMDELGINVATASGEMKDLPSIIGILNHALKDHTSIQRADALATLFGSRNLAAMNVLMGVGEEGLKAYSKELSEAGGTAKTVAERQLASFSGQMTLLKSAVDGAAVSVGLAFIPTLTRLSAAAIPLVEVAMESLRPVLANITGSLDDFFLRIESGDSVFGSARTAFLSLLPEGMAQGFLSLEAAIVSFVSTVSTIVSPITDAVSEFLSWKDVLLALGIVIASIVLPAMKGMAVAAAPIIAVAAGLILGVSLLRNAWESNWGGIQTITENAVAAIKDTLNDIWTGITTGDWEAIKTSLANLGTEIDVIMANTAATIKAAAAEWGTNLTGWVTENGPSIQTDITALAADIVTWLTSKASTIRTATAGWGASIKNWVTDNGPYLKANIDTLAKDAGTWIKAKATGIGDALKEWQTEAASLFTDITTGEGSITIGTWTVNLGVDDLKSAIGDALTAIDWSTITANFDALKTSIDTALADIPWDTLGTTVAGAINTAVNAITFTGDGAGTFGTLKTNVLNAVIDTIADIEWEGIGTALAALPNAVIAQMNLLNWEGIGTALGSLVNGVTAAISALDWSGIGTALAGFVNGVVAAINVIDWSGIAGAITGLANAVIGAIAAIEWTEVGTAFAKLVTGVTAAIAALDWTGLGTAFGKLVNGVVAALKEITWTGESGIGSSVFNGMVDAIVAAGTEIDWSPIGKAVGKWIYDSIAFWDAGEGTAFGTVIDNVKDSIITAFTWDDYIDKMEWATEPSSFTWDDYTSELVWATEPTSFTWDDYTNELVWATEPASFSWDDYADELVWAEEPSSFTWSAWIKTLTWSTVPAIFAWGSWIKALTWASEPSTFSWSDWIKSFEWPTLPVFPGWRAFIGNLTGTTATPAAPGTAPAGGGGGPGRALGDRFFRGGLALVGEQGPELISMPKGTRIYSNPETQGLLAGAGNGGGIVVNIHANVGDGVDIERMAYRVAEVISRRGR